MNTNLDKQNSVVDLGALSMKKLRKSRLTFYYLRYTTAILEPYAAIT